MLTLLDYFPGFYGPLSFYSSGSLLLLSNTLGVCAMSTTQVDALPYYILVFPFIDIVRFFLFVCDLNCLERS